jgi:hypothetical protein
MQFKFEIKGLHEAVEKTAYDDLDNGGKRTLMTQKVDVDFEVFGQIRKYGFEYMGNC